MLEMGEPVRIVDLARNLLRLAGVRSRNGEHVVFTGLRPGEKLHEELVAPEEETLETAVPKVRLIRRSELAGRSLLATLIRWEVEMADGSVDGVVDSLRAMFPGLSLALPSDAHPHTRARLTSATGTERSTPRTP
jgi:FlaA1/EpsC-like NDP-sugar epimerase